MSENIDNMDNAKVNDAIDAMKISKKGLRIYFLAMRTYFEQSKVLPRYSLKVMSIFMGMATFFTTRNGLFDFVSDVKFRTLPDQGGYPVLANVLNKILVHIGGISTLVAIAVESILVIAVWNIDFDKKNDAANRRVIYAYSIALAVSFFFSVVSLVNGTLHRDSKQFVLSEWAAMFGDARTLGDKALEAMTNPPMTASNIEQIRQSLEGVFNIAAPLSSANSEIFKEIDQVITLEAVRRGARNSNSQKEPKLKILTDQINERESFVKTLNIIAKYAENSSVTNFNVYVAPYLNRKLNTQLRRPITQKDINQYRDRVHEFVASDIAESNHQIFAWKAQKTTLEDTDYDIDAINDSYIDDAKRYIKQYINISEPYRGMDYRGVDEKIKNLLSWSRDEIDSARDLTDSLCRYSNEAQDKLTDFDKVIERHFPQVYMQDLVKSINVVQSQILAGYKIKYDNYCAPSEQQKNSATSLAIIDARRNVIRKQCDDPGEESNKQFEECLEILKEFVSTHEQEENIRILTKRAGDLEYMLSPEASPVTQLVGAFKLGVYSSYIAVIISLILSSLPVVCAIAFRRFSVETQLSNHFLPPEGIEATLRSCLDDPTSSTEYVDLLTDILGMNAKEEISGDDINPAELKGGLSVPPAKVKKYSALFCSLAASGNVDIRAPSGGLFLKPALVAWLQEQLMDARVSKRFTG